jgi:hypothetical protein
MKLRSKDSSEMWGPHGGEVVDRGLLSCDAIRSVFMEAIRSSETSVTNKYTGITAQKTNIDSNPDVAN